MPWTTPRTWASLELPTAANFNQHIRDNLAWLGTDKPRCILTRAAALSVPSATLTPVLWDAESVDVGAMHDLATNTDRITIPANGWYRLILTGQSAAAVAGGALRQGLIYKNGVQVTTRISGPFATTGYWDIGVAVSVQATAGDYFSAGLFHDAGVAIVMNTPTMTFSAIWEAT